MATPNVTSSLKDTQNLHQQERQHVYIPFMLSFPPFRPLPERDTAGEEVAYRAYLDGIRLDVISRVAARWASADQQEKATAPQVSEEDAMQWLYGQLRWTPVLYDQNRVPVVVRMERTTGRWHWAKYRPVGAHQSRSAKQLRSPLAINWFKIELPF